MATRRPARWYLDTGKDLARERGLYKKSADVSERLAYLAKQRALRAATLKQNVRNLRQYFKGFDAGSGYNLSDLKSWNAKRVEQIEKYSTYLHHLQSQPFDRLITRSKRQRVALQTFTGQSLPRQKAFVVHKPTERDTVSMNREGFISIQRELPEGRGFLKSDYYLFLAMLGWQPTNWDDVYAATGELLPFMPEGDYFIYSSLHGEIDTPHPKRMLLRLIQRYGQEYVEKKFAHTIIGFRRLSDEITRNKEAMLIQERRQKRKNRKDKQWKQLQSQVIRATKHKR